MDYKDLRVIAEEALNWGKERYPEASQYKHAAFANSVVYARFGMTGRYGGPSIREHVANAALNDVLVDWQDATLPEIYVFLSSWIYGRLVEPHMRFWMSHKDVCHDNDPEDERILEEREAKYKFATTRIWSSTLDKMRLIASLRNESMVKAWNHVAEEELTRLQPQSE